MIVTFGGYNKVKKKKFQTRAYSVKSFLYLSLQICHYTRLHFRIYFELLIAFTEFSFLTIKFLEIFK